MKNNYYVYFHYFTDINNPFYIGHGKGNRAYDLSSRSTAWREYVNLNKNRNNLNVNVSIVETDLHLVESVLLENKLIDFYGLDRLINVSKQSVEYSIRQREGVKKRIESGLSMGRKRGSTESKENFLNKQKNKEIIVLLKEGYNISQTSRLVGCSRDLVRKVKHTLDKINIDNIKKRNNIKKIHHHMDMIRLGIYNNEKKKVD